VTAIIGGTGSGKSTLINLIPRFYDVDSGAVLVDGVDVRQVSQKGIRAKIGFVPQTPVLFSGTVSENIRYGKADATLEEIAHAAEIAQASEFIAGMKDGYESVIAQGGTNLSGGQKQRLSIARALVRKPGIYILDDSFSALDFKTDARLRAALRKETRRLHRNYCCSEGGDGDGCRQDYRAGRRTDRRHGQTQGTGEFMPGLP
jgi:ATP-binding cassette subfamily B protein